LHTPKTSAIRYGLRRIVAAGASAATLAMFGLAAAASPATAATSHTADYRAACPAAPVGYSSCNALVRTDIKPQLAHKAADGAVQPSATVSGYGPTQLQSAYNLASAAAANGTGETVAVVDAFDDPNAASDLAVYRSQYGLR
jgi:hypothetical protein